MVNRYSHVIKYDFKITELADGVTWVKTYFSDGTATSSQQEHTPNGAIVDRPLHQTFSPDWSAWRDENGEWQHNNS